MMIVAVVVLSSLIIGILVLLSWMYCGLRDHEAQIIERTKEKP